MKVLELFAGTRSIGKAFEACGHEVFSVEWDKRFDRIDLYADISTLTAQDILGRFGRPDVIWASPDCSTFSVMAISTHRRKNPETGELDPITEYAKFCDKVDQHVLELIKELQPAFYFIENPRAGMRKMAWMQDLPRYTVTYCQYGDPCHDRAPRSATLRKMKAMGLEIPRGGTQDGIRTSKERAVIPRQLCEHIVRICEKYIPKEEEAEAWML